ncbi:hypothetical protein C8Q74DRAFT_797556 [Fomes fomentarius]|nr:hypothetical protein C8Q74DRAFT_797556 [Fomes fomentarius]
MTARLASEGKRLVKAPRLLPDGIAFDWVCDATARNEDMRNLLSVEGIRTGDLERVLDRAAPVSGGSSRAVTEEVPVLNRPNLLSCLNSKQQAHSLVLPRNASAGDASNPIVIQDDMEDDIAPGALSKCEEYQQQPDRLPQCEVATMPRYSDDLSHATASAATTQFGMPTVIQPRHISLEENRSSAALSQSSVNDPIQEPGAHSSTGAAYYGEWKVLANDSSDAEMEDGHQSSRESSVARSLPPQPAHHVLPDLPFLPQTYDTSSLFSQQSFTSIPCPYRTGVHGETISSRSERERSTPPRVPALPSRTSYRTLNEALEYSSNRTATDSIHPPRRASRQKPLQHVQSSDHSEDDSGGEPTNKVRVSQEAPHDRKWPLTTFAGPARVVQLNGTRTAGLLQPQVATHVLVWSVDLLFQKPATAMVQDRRKNSEMSRCLLLRRPRGTRW